MFFNHSLCIKRSSVLVNINAFLLFFFFSNPVIADNIDSLGMLANLTAGLPNVMRLVTASAYVLGMWIVINGIFGLKIYGEQRTQYSSHASLKGPLLQFTVGTCLLYLPTAVTVGLNTFWSDPTPYAYFQESANDWYFIRQSGFMVAQLIGVISFIRGLLLMNKLSGAGGQQDAFSRGLTHMIAGSMCINLYDFLHMVNATLGI